LKKKLTLGVGLIFLFAISAFAEDDHSIDLKEARCIEADSSTAGMANCTKQAEVEWDQELNKYYGLLIKSLNKEQAELLRQAQRAWLEYRDKEIKNISTFFSSKAGTMWIPIRAAHYNDLVKQRALELKNYYDLLKY
jgi:uncharacterized protein YecT (DUF1311 family)